MENLDALVTYQRQLDEEEAFITKLLRQIDQQINSLQVEQMELQSTMYASGHALPKVNKSEIDAPLEKNFEQLDLSVPVKLKNDTEEEEEEDDEEDDEEL